MTDPATPNPATSAPAATTPAKPESAPHSLHIVAVNAGVSDPSSTRLLADRLTQRALERLRSAGLRAEATVIDLAPLAVDIARAGVSGLTSDSLRAVTAHLASADALIVATPVYKAGISGLFKSFFDILDNDLLIAKPVVVATTAGSPRHTLVADEHLRPLLAFMRALTTPTAVSAAPEDWASPQLGSRIERAATELVHLVRAGVAEAIADDAWAGYQHRFGGNATRAQQTATDVDFDTDLMRLAAGGALPPRPLNT
ncbi:CE1759 family FMN reductase [Streptomyces sp. NPDC048279]|uniref:CE1759 family FMN reductase n=1 Tax=Streptomyces sp. NPDC048279 TaxID=3154714 RepID=UPI0034122E57